MKSESTQTRSPFPSVFYVANTMEIFERLSWYGIYTFLAVYLTSSKGLGLAPNEQSLIMGVGTFVLYLVPAFAGALADRFGYRVMFIAAFCILAPGYYLLGQVETFTGFFLVFLMVALGGGMFKPVVTATVGLSTDDTNRGIGFGIFYMMVNIGGALGPIVAQWTKGTLGWSWAFSMAAIWISINFIPAIFFYKDPSKKNKKKNNKSIKEVFQELQQVLGNGRLALLVVPILVVCTLKAGKLINVTELMVSITAIIAGSWIWNLFCSDETNDKETKLSWYRQKIKVGNKFFVIYLLILSGFWTVYNQVFYSFPLYVQHYVNTSDLIKSAESTGSEGFVDYLTGISIDTLSQDLIGVANTIASSEKKAEQKQQDGYILLSELQIKVPKEKILPALTTIHRATNDADRLVSELHKQQVNGIKLTELRSTLVTLSSRLVKEPINVDSRISQVMDAFSKQKIKIEEKQVLPLINSVYRATSEARVYAEQWSENYRQVDPQVILVLEFVAIVLLQILISHFIARWRPLPVLLVGTCILSFGLWIGGLSHMFVFGGFAAATAVVVFAIGEIITSPKSQEYVASFAPRDKVGMYMGYYFVSIALGSLFAGILSGSLYGSVVMEMGKPVLFWSIFGGIGLFTAFCFFLFNRAIAHKESI